MAAVCKTNSTSMTLSKEKYAMLGVARHLSQSRPGLHPLIMLCCYWRFGTLNRFSSQTGHQVRGIGTCMGRHACNVYSGRTTNSEKKGPGTDPQNVPVYTLLNVLCYPGGFCLWHKEELETITDHFLSNFL